MESLAERVREEVWLRGSQVQVITSATSLAHQGLLGPVEKMRLREVDLSSIPAEHLVSLVSCVTRCAHIKNVSGCDLVTILDCVKSKALWIDNQSLGREETEALVRALETRVERVGLYCDIEDIEALTKFNGQGECWEVSCWYDVVAKYSEKLKTWAKRINWEVIPSASGCFEMKRP